MAGDTTLLLSVNQQNLTNATNGDVSPMLNATIAWTNLPDNSTLYDIREQRIVLPSIASRFNLTEHSTRPLVLLPGGGMHPDGPVVTVHLPTGASQGNEITRQASISETSTCHSINAGAAASFGDAHLPQGADAFVTVSVSMPSVRVFPARDGAVATDLEGVPVQVTVTSLSGEGSQGGTAGNTAVAYTASGACLQKRLPVSVLLDAPGRYSVYATDLVTGHDGPAATFSLPKRSQPQDQDQD